MDLYNSQASILDPGDPTAAQWVAVRAALGATRQVASRIDLTTMLPHPELASTGYCLARPQASAAAYLVYLPSGGSASIDLSATQATLTVDWISPDEGASVSTATVKGGTRMTLQAPFAGDAVVYVH
jgi:archaellin